jgi:4-hydroxy-tetrahydrodipicolinate reductase
LFVAQSDIERVRDRSTQLFDMNVPESYLDGHAFHTYTLTSPDGDVSFSFQHNVCGRTIYAEGTVDAVLFLAKKIEQGSKKKVFNMIDVLREGAMR